MTKILTLAIAFMALTPTIPATMNAVAIDQPGGPEALVLRTLPVPGVEANEVLIAVHSAGVAVWDTQIRKSLAFINAPKFPYVLGSDGSGLVAAVGRSVTRFKVGDAVYAYCWDNPKGGFYAEFVAVSSDCVARIPKGISLDAAGALGASGLTALSGVDRALSIKRGDTVIIHGASGAVGTLALQLAKLRGARVLATASGEEGLALVSRLGADAVVDGRNGDITAAARAFAPKGADAVLAFAGGAALEKCLDALRAGGRVAYPNGVEPVPKPREGLTIIPFDALSGDQKVQFAQLNRAIEARHFEVPIAATFSLAEAANAHRRIEAGKVAGKVVLKIRTG
ncbi:MAG TPA: NADP-dependent oxidoreductase [Steroidobacteraceae bacterium]|jgi:NADPH:quinone reductase-like Zn-dependent oxidoreductase|nr:NADP-dependent oxidoreductase [Steroidobacteraceae bacterium]